MYHRLVKLIFHCVTLTAMAGTAAAAATPLSIPNGSFEQGGGTQPEAWVWKEPSDSLQAEWTEGIAHRGRRAIKVRMPGEVSPGIAWCLACTTPVPVDSGRDYIASFWLKATCDRPVKLVIDGYHEGKLVKPRLGEGRAYVRQGAVLGFGPCDWTQFERGFEVPEGVSSLRFSFIGKFGTDLLIDDVEICPGRRPYHPAGKLVEGHVKSRVEEKLDRGLVAVHRPDGVYVGWRLLRQDPANIAFRLYRKEEDGRSVRVSAAPITDTADYLDTAPQAEKATGYRLCSVWDEREEALAVCRVETCEPEKAYHTIRLAWPDNRPAPLMPKIVESSTKSATNGSGPTSTERKLAFGQRPCRPVIDVEKVGIGDLDGDGRYDFVLKHPSGHVLLYDDYTKWNRSPETYKIDAFTADGKHLWRRDLGWGIEHRNWLSPIIVHDLNGDGRAEVVAKVAEGDSRNERGRVVEGPESFAIWDGLTGEEIVRAPWPTRAGFDCYNFVSRNQLAVAYLDGRTPCLIVLRGTYGLMKVEAHELVGSQLKPLWKFCNANAPSQYWGQGAHFTQCLDVDGDGRDEVALGSMVLDDTGVPLWSTGKGHPDGLFIGDIDPIRAGLEMYNYIELRNTTGGMILVDAGTGETLWELQVPTSHVHGGLCADVDPAAPGLECFGVDKKPIDGKEQIVGSWLKTAAGEPLETPTDWGFGKPTIYWDADLQKELIIGRSIQKYRGGRAADQIRASARLTLTAPAGRSSLVKKTGSDKSAVQWPIPAYDFVPVDLLGDWREELLEFTEQGELRIHFSTIPAMDRRACLMQDPIYRRDIAMCAMAYHRPAMLSYCPAAKSTAGK